MMNITSVNNFNSLVGTLGSINGQVTQSQLNDLQTLFSTQIWNSADSENTSVALDRQIKLLENMLEEIQADIVKLYEEQKTKNDELNALVQSMEEESYQASKQADRNARQQRDAVADATDEAYKAYMRGDIEKDEIPGYIAQLVGKTSENGQSALQAHLDAMDYKGQKLVNLSNKIAAVLDSINEFKAKFDTTKASLGLLERLKASMPEHKTRDDIENTTKQVYYTPIQEALGNKIIDAFQFKDSTTQRSDRNGTMNSEELNDKFSYGNEAVRGMRDGLEGSGVKYDTPEAQAARKDELDAMTDEEKAAAVEEADFSKYSVAELMYLAGFDETQAAHALGQIFRGAGVGYNDETGALIVPKGHWGAAVSFRELEHQYTTLWGEGAKIEEGSMDDNGNKGGKDPIGWSDGNTRYMFAVDDGNGRYDGPEEDLGAENGWADLVAFDDNGDNIITADELEAHNVYVRQSDDSLVGGGTYGFSGVKDVGFESLDLNSYKEIADGKNVNLNGNTRVGEFDMTVNGQQVLGTQTVNTDEFNETFYGYMYGDAISYGLDPDEVANVLAEAANIEDYTAGERADVDATLARARNITARDKTMVSSKTRQLENASTITQDGTELEDREVTDEQKSEEEKEKEEEENE